MSNTITKPKYLYHGSPYKDLEVISPRNKKVRDPLEGKVVFATEGKMFASTFIVPADDSWSIKTAFSSGTEGPHGELVTEQYAIYDDRDRFMKLDAGGAIYTLPSETFYLHSEYDAREWTSREPVRPVSKEVFDSGLNAMLKYGVNVCFVDKDTIRRIRDADDHGYGIIMKLKCETLNG